MTVPVNISARNGIFDIAIPQTNLEATTFIQNLTRQGQNFSEVALSGYATASGTYIISTQFCVPSASNVSNPMVQVLTHGVGLDKTYLDISYNNFDYSYADVATDTYKYCTLSHDRLGIGKSSHGEPVNEIQSFLEVAALAELTNMLRDGTFPEINQTFSKVTHVGHSFGSDQTYALVNMYPKISDGIVLTDFSTNPSFSGYFAAGGAFVQANLNQPFRFGNASTSTIETVLDMYSLTDLVAGAGISPELDYANGYLTNTDATNNQYQFFLPGYFDPMLLLYSKVTKQPVTVGELLTQGSLAMANAYAGPVLVIAGSNNLPFCGGDCLATGNVSLPSIPAAVAMNFPNVPSNNSEAPNTGHGINLHYNATGAYNVIKNFLIAKV